MPTRRDNTPDGSYLAGLSISPGLANKINGLYDQAIADFSQAIRLAPNLDYAYFNRGRTYEINGERQRAVKDFMKSYALNSDDRAYQAKMKELGLLQ